MEVQGVLDLGSSGGGNDEDHDPEVVVVVGSNSEDEPVVDQQQDVVPFPAVQAVEQVILYFFEFSSPSRKVLMGLYELGVQFESRHVDLTKREQHQRWFLEMNPRGEVPVLRVVFRNNDGQAPDDDLVTESSAILEYADKNLSSLKGRLFPHDAPKVRRWIKALDWIPSFPLTYGAAVFHTEHVTDRLRWPFNLPGLRDKYRQMILDMPEVLKATAAEVADLPAGKVLAEKASGTSRIWPMLLDLDLYRALLTQVEAVLDEAEAELASEEDGGGPWLCGPTFTAADVALTCLLLRLHQLGMDEVMWKKGKRPHLSVYQEMAFSRPAFEKATQWSQHRDEVLYISGNSGCKMNEAAQNAAYVGLASIVALGSIYAFKKLFIRK